MTKKRQNTADGSAFANLTNDDFKILERVVSEKDPADLAIKDMTAGMYLDIVRKGMIQVCPDLSTDPIKSYLSFADGRHYDLVDIDMNSPDEFKKWYGKYAFAGGHPFEIFYNVMHLWVLNNNGFYLRLASNNMPEHHLPVILKAYKGLRAAGIPFEFSDRERIADMFKKNKKR